LERERKSQLNVLRRFNKILISQHKKGSIEAAYRFSSVRFQSEIHQDGGIKSLIGKG
jgi:hypothetical protein